MRTYGWSVRMYVWRRGDRVRAIRPDIPQPNSRTIESEVIIWCWRSGFVGEDIHFAKRGVIFHITVYH